MEGGLTPGRPPDAASGPRLEFQGRLHPSRRSGGQSGGGTGGGVRVEEGEAGGGLGLGLGARQVRHPRQAAPLTRLLLQGHILSLFHGVS